MLARSLGSLIVLTGLVAAGYAVPAQAARSSVSFANQTLVSYTGVASSHDFEPSVRIGSDGTIYEGANYHNIVTGDRAVEIWQAPFGTSLTSDGIVPPSRGGLDQDIALGSTGNLYVGTLFYHGSGNWGIGSGTCPAGTLPGDTSACYGVQNVDVSHDDRPWVAADGASTAYLSYRDGSASEQIDVAKSTDAGKTWGPGVRVISPDLASQTNFNNLHGNLAIDPVSHTLYQVFVAGITQHKGTNFNLNEIYVAVSHDGGQTWVSHLAYDGPYGASYNNFWPVVTVDAGGNVYAGWSDRHDIWITSSSDQGVSWTAPVKISQDSASLQSSEEPWIYGGAAGDLAVVWYGSSDPNNMDSSATWNAYFAQVRNAASTSPSITQVVVTDHVILTGALCTQGDACPSGTRYLFDDFGVALDPRTGLAAIAYGDASDPNNRYQVGVAWQTGGAGL